jgi:thymidylate kinase
MLILVEGSDCARKSTLVARLAERVAELHPGDQVNVWHAGPPTKHPLDEYVVPLLDYRPARGRHVICDRWHLGESVYPHVFGRETKFDMATQAYTDLFLRSRGALLVHVDAQVEDVEECLRTRGDELVSPEQASSILRQFRNRARVSLLPTLVVEGFKVSEDDVEAILRQARVLDYVQRTLAPFTTYVGSRTPSTLLLGDVRHGHVKGEPNLLPAFMPYGATSGHYLFTQLVARYGFQVLKHVGVANACDDDDHEALWTLLGKPPTVALGRRARKRTPWATRDVPHPQWVRRFKHAEGAAYAKEVLVGT